MSKRIADYRAIGDTIYIYRIVNGRTDYPKLLKQHFSSSHKRPLAGKILQGAVFCIQYSGEQPERFLAQTAADIKGKRAAYTACPSR